MLFFVTLLASTVGAGLIADDAHTNALTLYLSRPITHVDYLIAKGAILGTLVILITILPLFIAALLAGLLSFVSWGVAPAAMGGAVALGPALPGFFPTVPPPLPPRTPRKPQPPRGA